MSVPVIAGRHYRVALAAATDQTSSVQLSGRITPPNDRQEQALTQAGGVWQTSGSNVGASADPGEAIHDAKAAIHAGDVRFVNARQTPEGKLVATSANGHFLTLIDNQWKLHLTGAARLDTVWFVGGAYHAFDPDTHTMLRSEDGETWVRSPLPYLGYGRLEAAGDRLFLLGGDVSEFGTEPALTSTNGITWRPTNLSKWGGIAFGHNQFASAGPELHTSSDGIDWSPVVDGLGNVVLSDHSSRLQFLDGHFVSAELFSADGIRWRRIQVSDSRLLFLMFSGGGAIDGGGIQVMVGHGAFASSDGLNWIRFGAPADMLVGVGFQNGGFVAVTGQGRLLRLNLQDLAIKDAGVAGEIFAPGDQLPISMTLHSQSLSASSGQDFDVEFRLSVNAVSGDADDRLLGHYHYVWNEALAAEQPSVAVEMPLPADLAPGDYHLIIRIDANNAVSEFDESNNTFVLRRQMISIPAWTLEVASVGGGAVHSSETAGRLVHRSRVTLVPVAAKGHVFTGWQGAAGGTLNTLSLTMDQNRSVTAYFRPRTPYWDWAAAHLPPDFVHQPRLASPDADPDGDGVPNAMERALGTDPIRTDPPAVTLTRNAEGLRIRYRLPHGARSEEWRVEYSQDLIHWSVPAWEWRISEDEEGQHFEGPAPESAGSGSGYVRLRSLVSP